MGVFETMYNTRAMRRLKPDEVPEELLLKLIDAANRAPTGSNMQGMRWILIREPEQRAKLAAINKALVEMYVGPNSARAAALPHQDEAQRERQIAAVMWQADHLAEIPALVIACMEFAEPTGTGAAARGGGSVWPGVQNLLLAARALGLGAAPTTIGLSDRDTIRELLGLPENVEAFALIPVGYPMGKFGPVTRMPVEETLHWDRW